MGLKENEDGTALSGAQQQQYNDQSNMLQKQVVLHKQQIEILNESTKQNLLKRQSMKQDLYKYYQSIRTIRDSISGSDRIKMQDNKDFLELIVKNNFLES